MVIFVFTFSLCITISNIISLSFFIVTTIWNMLRSQRVLILSHNFTVAEIQNIYCRKRCVGKSNSTLFYESTFSFPSEEDNNLLKIPPLPAIRDSPGSRMSYRRDSDHEDAFRRSARRSTKARKGVGSLKTSSSFGGNSLQLDAIQRGQRLLDARMQVNQSDPFQVWCLPKVHGPKWEEK